MRKGMGFKDGAKKDIQPWHKKIFSLSPLTTHILKIIESLPNPEEGQT